MLLIKGKVLVRLTNGNSSHSGTVEVFYNGRWGTICDDYWTDADAQVVCHMIGYQRYITFHFIYFFPIQKLKFPFNLRQNVFPQ